ncbi:putative eukaryotic initiation factor-2B, alpha subunit [Cryptosporidium felis]|nr:putative eukaryotic initiation factor-2B, alpha subunit [Cryptosporidium felis]
MPTEIIGNDTQHNNSSSYPKADVLTGTGRKNVDKIIEYFWDYLERESLENRHSRSCIPFISTLLSLATVVSESPSNNAPELLTEMSAAKDILMISLSEEKYLKKLISEYGITNISLSPICRIFESKLLKILVYEDFLDNSRISFLKKNILHETNQFVKDIVFGMQKIVDQTLSVFVKDRMIILTFGYNELIEMTLENAWLNLNKQYNLLIVLPSEDFSLNDEFSIRNGLFCYHKKNILEWKRRLNNKGITVSIITMDTIYNAMNIVDFVILSIECVLENGSVIGISGTATITSIAKTIFNKPVYIVTQATKFTNILPFNVKINKILYDITYQNSQLSMNPITSFVDLSENSYLTMFFTDLGVITPQNVSVEIKQLVSF